MNLAEILTRTAAARPDGLALVCGETRLTYAELDVAGAGVASRLRCTRPAPPGRRRVRS